MILNSYLAHSGDIYGFLSTFGIDLRSKEYMLMPLKWSRHPMDNFRISWNQKCPESNHKCTIYRCWNFSWVGRCQRYMVRKQRHPNLSKHPMDKRHKRLMMWLRSLTNKNQRNTQSIC